MQRAALGPEGGPLSPEDGGPCSSRRPGRGSVSPTGRLARVPAGSRAGIPTAPPHDQHPWDSAEGQHLVSLVSKTEITRVRPEGPCGEPRRVRQSHWARVGCRRLRGPVSVESASGIFPTAPPRPPETGQVPGSRPSSVPPGGAALPGA